MKKRLFSLVLALVMLCGMIPVPSMAAEPVTEITLWTYPIGGWGNYQQLEPLLAEFEAATGIRVAVEYLTYTDGDNRVNEAIAKGTTPDLILEGPERLVSNWGMKGVMVDLSDLMDDMDRAQIYSNVLAACTAPDGAVYEYPLCMTVHCMAINKTVFEAAGAMQYLNEETHTWNSTEDFFKAVQAVYEYTGSYVGSVYCGGQGGDQGTRALVNNLYGGTFTNLEHTAYTWNSPENIAALQALYDCEGIVFDPTLVGGSEISLFWEGHLNMAFCWNIAQQLNPNTAYTGAGKTVNGDEILFMAFPSTETPQLNGGVWGFGIFDNGDEEKIAAAKTFIKYMCDSEATEEAVTISNYFPARSAAEGVDLTAIWADDEIMAEYNKLMPMFGDYYQVTSNWSQARTAWWSMLQDVGNGEDIEAAVTRWNSEANYGNSSGGDHIYHNFDEWVTVREATVDEVGIEKRSCKHCVYTETRLIPKLDAPAEPSEPEIPEEPEVPENPFADVSDSDYFLEPVLWAVANGITSGTGNGNFSPNNNCTRGQVVTFLWRAMGQPDPVSTENPFSDVSENDYFFKPVLWAVENGITSGTGGGKFSPNDPCTRGQVVTFLWRAMGKPEAASNENPFSDVNSGDYFFMPVLWAVENGITSGTGNGKFSPGNPCTRGQVVTFLFRAMKEQEVTEVTLSVWVSPEDQAGAGSWLSQARKLFEQAHPELSITWDLRDCYEGDAAVELTADPSNGPDVYFLTGDQLTALIQVGALEALDGKYLAQVQRDVSATYQSNFTGTDGKIYGFPMSPNTWFMYYNKSLLSEADVKSIEAMLAKGKVAFELENSWYLPSFFFAAGGTMFGESGIDASAGIQFGGDVGLTATNAILDLLDHPNFVVDRGGEGFFQMATGKIVAFFSGSWNYSDLYNALGDSLGCAALPTVNINGTAAQLKAYANSKALGVNPHADNLDLAMEFAAFLASSEMQLLRYQLRGITPAVTALAEHPDVAANAVASAEIATMAYATVPQPSIPEMSNVWGIMSMYGTALANGNVTRDNAPAYVAEINAALNAY